MWVVISWVVVSISYPQAQIGLRQSWKQCLKLCSRRWLRPRCNLVLNLIFLGLWQSKILICLGCINFIFFLKILKLSNFLYAWCRSYAWKIIWSLVVKRVQKTAEFSIATTIFKTFRFSFPVQCLLHGSLVAPVMANDALYWTDSIFWWKELL